jgi:hypothetical protein
MFSVAFAFVAFVCLFVVSKLIKRCRQRAREARVRLEGEEVSQVVNNYGSISRPQGQYVIGDARSVNNGVVREAGYFPDRSHWVL